MEHQATEKPLAVSFGAALVDRYLCNHTAYRYTMEVDE